MSRPVCDRLATGPRAQRRVITSHDPFGGFGVACGVDFEAPQAWTTHSQPTDSAVTRLGRQIPR